MSDNDVISSLIQVCLACFGRTWFSLKSVTICRVPRYANFVNTRVGCVSFSLVCKRQNLKLRVLKSKYTEIRSLASLFWDLLHSYNFKAVKGTRIFAEQAHKVYARSYTLNVFNTYYMYFFQKRLTVVYRFLKFLI